MRNLLRITVALIFCLTTLSCGDDEVERPDYTMVKCRLELGTGWLQLYDITVQYMTPTGLKESLLLDKEVWEYSEKADGQYKSFLFKATAKAKRTTFDMDDEVQRHIVSKDQDLTYAHEFYYYEKETSAHSIKKKDEGDVVKAGKIEAYVAEHPNIVLFDHDITVGQK